MQNPIENDVSFFAPVCQVCRSQDESLRSISYPFVFSIIFATFQRAFSGVWCSRHQRRYHLLASLITSTVGWLGIPFGLFLTPLTLFKLARGGIVDIPESLQILGLISDKKLRNGDIQGAIRCLEESLKLQDNAEVREKLGRLYSQHRAMNISTSSSFWQFLSVPILLTVAILTGLLLGLLDNFLIFVLAPVFGAGGSIFTAILSWLPTVTILFFEVLLIRFMLRWALQKTGITSPLFGVMLAIAATCFAFYSILEGQAIIRNLQGLFTFFSVSTKDGYFALRSVLTHGGLDVLINNFKQGDLPNVIFSILFTGGTFLALYTGTEIALQNTRWQSHLSQLREPVGMETTSPTLVAIPLGLMMLGIVFINAIVFPGSFVNVEEAHWEISLGISELDQNHFVEAIRHFESAVNLWSDSVTSHTYLGIGYSWQEKYDQSLEELDTSLRLDPNSTIAHLLRAYVLTGQGRYNESLDEYARVAELQPAWGLPHAALANSYFALDQTERADQEIQLALRYEANDGQTSSAIASYYAQILDFKKAEEHMLRAIQAANNPNDYISLAQIYLSQEKFDQATKAIEEASRQGANPVDIYIIKIRAATSQDDLEAANAILTEAIRLYPNHSDLLSESSYLLFQKGNFEKSAREAEKAVEINPYNALGHIEKAFVYHAQGRLPEALAAAKQGVALYPKYDRAHYILGLCYMDLDMKAEAIPEFETFLKLYWERPLVKEYREKAIIYLEELR